MDGGGAAAAAVDLAADARRGAQAALPAVAIKSAADGVQTYSLTFQILILMTALTLLPAILLAMTAFTRIIIVLSILRQALGMATTPSNQVLTGLALFMTFFVMSSTLEQAYAERHQAVHGRSARRRSGHRSHGAAA
jgi:flagellar biosynthetic protein FliP